MREFEKINNACLVFLTLVAATIALIYTKTILVPFVISFFIFSIISPLIYYLEVKKKIPRYASLTLVIALFLGFTALLSLLLIKSFQDFSSGIEVYQYRLSNFINANKGFIENLGLSDSKALQKELLNLPLWGWAKTFSKSIIGFFSNASLILIITIFMIIGGQNEYKHKFLSEMQFKISRYVSTKLGTSITTGILVFLVLYFFNVELSFMFAILTILLNFIPTVGSIIATILPLPILFIQFGFSSKLTIILILCGLIQIVIGNIIEPKLMGENLDLHPLSILLFLMFWGLVWGIPGMFLAVPITAIMSIIFSRIKTTKPLSDLLAGRIQS